MPVQNAHTNSEQHPPLFSPGNMLPFFLVTALFLFWGIPSNLNDILIKQFMKSFELTRFKAGLIQSAFYMGYFVLAIPAALIMKRFGYKSGLVIGLFLYSAGTFLFWPAAWIFPLRPVRHRQWRIVSGDRRQLFCRHVGRSPHFGTAAQFFPGL
jgi:FHS family L-fucose permease-like MFS transporter